MKTALDIKNQLYNTPTFNKLQQKALLVCFFQELFPSLFPKILFTKLKETHQETTLLIALKHPAHVKEFNYILPTIKATLKAAASTRFDSLSKISNITIFVSRYAQQEESPSSPITEIFYHEHSQGTFQNQATSPALKNLFEEIRTIIQRHHRLKECEGEEGYYKRLNS